MGGVRAFFRGVAFTIQTPPVWPLALVPIATATALTAGFGFACVKWIPPAISNAIGAHGALGTALSILVQVSATGVALLLAILLAIALAQPLSGVALEAIVRRQEQVLGMPPRPEAGFWTSVTGSLSSLLLGVAISAPIFVVLVIVTWAFPPAAFVTVPLKLLVLAAVLAWDLCDYPLSMRGVPLSKRTSLMARDPGAVLGFGAALALVSLVPCGLFLILPAGVAGATHLLADLDRSGD
jgi:CysZ protein